MEMSKNEEVNEALAGDRVGQVKELRGKILLELSAVVNSLSSISDVLDDILDMTSGNKELEIPSGEEISSVADKQVLLLNELEEWKRYLGDGSHQAVARRIQHD